MTAPDAIATMLAACEGLAALARKGGPGRPPESADYYAGRVTGLRDALLLLESEDARELYARRPREGGAS